MGNFYVNFSVKSTDQPRVADLLREAGRVAIIMPPHNGFTVVFDQEADSQAVEPILEVGTMLSRQLAPVIAFLNHDDILCYWLFERGELVDEYNSCPDYFAEEEEADAEQGGDPRLLCRVLGAEASPGGVGEILRGETTFAVHQHQRLAAALGLPSWSVGMGYEYAERGELDKFDPNELNPDEIIRLQ